jgi:Polyketide cyclase / dehydrase and lipid transport
MPSFDQITISDGPPEEVWKLLYDPARFPDWWAGVGTVELRTAGDPGPAGYTMYPEGYPDFPMPQTLSASQENGTVTISCLVSDLCFAWRLRPVGMGTEISVHVEIPDSEAHRLDAQRDIIRQSLMRLAISAAQPQDSDMPAPPWP